MTTQPGALPGRGGPPGERTGRRGPWRLVARTLSKAWGGNLFSEAAESAFWQVLSLPPLLLGLLGSLGYVAEWFGKDVIDSVQANIITISRTAFSENVVTQIIEPTVGDILTVGRGEIVSVGFLISLWAGSSAMSSFVDAITVAHDQYGVRNEVWQRIFSLLIYMASLVLLIAGLPVLTLGPDLLPNLFPVTWRPTVVSWLSYTYYPALGLLIVLALATLYKLALPRKLPWHRGLPGALLAMVFFILSSIGLRVYITAITSTGYTYGALATPIAFLLFAYFIGLAVVIGAYFNAAIQELWPAKMTRRERRRWRRLEMERAAEEIRSGEAARAWLDDPEPAPATGAAPEDADDSPAGTTDPHNADNPGTADNPDTAAAATTQRMRVVTERHTGTLDDVDAAAGPPPQNGAARPRTTSARDETSA
ncbi:YihY/virulence factor BrkB family protein [Actinokineospora bangkokensis]|uniref:YihY/virulence factor BrkB family protein n=1 Tax=Actinokineospora bangkokensis TaxID=1193682 RepID=UPI00096ADEBE|nr:YihY/virulence factor BrkB family protein [Actinokineospora bangkokensis]